MANIAHVPTDENKMLVQGYYAAGVPKARIANHLNISEETLDKYYKDQLDKAKDAMIDLLGTNLFQAALAGDDKAREFWLKCQGRWSYAKPPEDDKVDRTNSLLEKLIDKL